MKGSLIKSWIGIFLAACCLAFSGCNTVGTNTDGLLEPARPTGELYEIQQALEQNASGGIQLKYPQTGSYRSAFVLHDCDGDGEEEALAFYALESEAQETVPPLHVSLIDRVEEEWRPQTEISLPGTINQVDFADLDGDGREEILLGWVQASTLENKLAVYTFRENTLIQRMQENYTQYAVCNLISGRRTPQLLLFLLNTADKVASAQLLSLQSGGIQQEGTVSLDGGATSYTAPQVGYLKDGTPAVYLDAYKGTAAMITEIVYYATAQPGLGTASDASGMAGIVVTGLVSPFHDSATLSNDITLRPVSAVSRDMDHDNVLDMPLMTPLPGYESVVDAEKLYLTTWRNYDGRRFENVFASVMNYEEEYYLRFPQKWAGDNTVNVTMSRTSGRRESVFYVWDPVNRIRGEELLSIQVVSGREWEERDQDQWQGYIELAQKNGQYYVAKITATSGVYALTEETLRSCFGLIQ